jgi:hypothetical protein
VQELADEMLTRLDELESITIDAILDPESPAIGQRAEDSGRALGRACGQAALLPESPETRSIQRVCVLILAAADELAESADPGALYDAIDEARELLEPLR